jgi:hypothetical protein
VQRLLTSRRLVLVLDLDHTLLNTVRDADLAGSERAAAEDMLAAQHKVRRHHDDAQQQPKPQQQQQEEQPQPQQEQVDGEQQQQQQQQQQEQVDATYQQEQQKQQEQQQQQQQASSGATAACTAIPMLHHFASKGLWTKLRPGVAAFLAALAPLYELHIYTMGDKGYAGLMADILDPGHSLFVGRVVSAVCAPSCVLLSQLPYSCLPCACECISACRNTSLLMLCK